MLKITLDQVSKKIKNNWVLKNISYTFQGGTLYGVYGYNGSGKTMLLRMISGLIRPTEGSIFINDKKLHAEIDYPESIGVLIESPNFWKNYTGFEVLKTLAGIKKVISDDEIKNAMKRVLLDPEDKRTISKYSLGMKQKLGIAQAIMEHPDIILLDEPTNALDKKSVTQVRQILLEEKKRGAIVIIASHNSQDIDLCDQMIEVTEGVIENA